MPNLSYALWSIWIELPLLHKLFFFGLFTVGVYSLFSAAKVLWRVRSLRASGQSKDVTALRNEVAALSARSTSIRHLITTGFYLFGIVFFWGLRFTLWTPDISGNTPVLILILQNFFLYFAFAANAFFVFLILHLVQWFVSARLQACAQYLSALHRE